MLSALTRSESSFSMLENRTTPKNRESGQVTLMHLLKLIAFCMPIAAAMPELEHSGGGMLRYLVAVPSALALGVLIVSLDWKLGRTVWLRSQRYSKKAQNAITIALFVGELLWIGIGGVSGFKVAALIGQHVPR
jgi:hypothetical protein